MRTTVRTLAGLTAACAIGAATAAVAPASAAPSQTTRPAGTSFVAPTANGGVSIALSADGRQVRNALFAYESTCSDGDSFTEFEQFSAIPIGANRKFSHEFKSAPVPSTTMPGATFSYTVSFSGLVNKAGTKIVGTARSTLAFMNPAGASFTCDSGAVSFKAAN